jgi:hypothetical protein
MKRTIWLIAICIASIAATFLFSHSCWFKRNEHVAIWLEGVALVFIFALDYINRLDDSEQLGLLRQQVAAAKKQADFSSDSLSLLKSQAQEQQLRELWRVLPILDDIQSQMRFWLNLFNENRWNAVNESSKIMPPDSSSVLVQAARHSNELWTNVRETFRMIINADNQIARYYGQSNPAYRQESLIREAHAFLRNAEPRLTEITGVFAVFEQEERDRRAPQAG